MSVKPTVPIIAAALVCLTGGVARSAPGKGRAGGGGPTAAEFAELKQKVDQQSELLMRLTQLEGEHYEILIKWIQNNSRSGKGVVAPPVLPTTDATTPGSSATKSQVSSADTDLQPPPGAKPKLGTITGHVDVKGKPWGPIYVYVENIKEPFVDRSVEIAQKDRGFVPNVLVVQRGTRVSFPNGDPFMHNVFSPSPTHPFDLGSYKQGEKAGLVRMVNAGVVEVLCNMHAKMRAAVLVVPNRHFVKVGGDGSFRLDNVPVGQRQVVAWTPDAKPMTESVMLTPAGASVRFGLQVDRAPVPLDKAGNPRSGYRQED